MRMVNSMWIPCIKRLIQPIELVVSSKMIWMTNIPLKTNVFSWYLPWGVSVTKNNLAKHNWQRSKKFIFFYQDGKIKHVFFFLYLYGQSSK
jgi:hypothetical protein